jgi:hypothetical protein
MTDRPHVVLDVTNARIGRPSIAIQTEVVRKLNPDEALTLSIELRSAALLAAQAQNEKDFDVPDHAALDLVRGA